VVCYPVAPNGIIDFTAHALVQHVISPVTPKNDLPQPHKYFGCSAASMLSCSMLWLCQVLISPLCNKHLFYMLLHIKHLRFLVASLCKPTDALHVGPLDAIPNLHEPCDHPGERAGPTLPARFNTPRSERTSNHNVNKQQWCISVSVMKAMASAIGEEVLQHGEEPLEGAAAVCHTSAPIQFAPQQAGKAGQVGQADACPTFAFTQEVPQRGEAAPVGDTGACHTSAGWGAAGR
jgi:hypothetical protein